MPHLPRVVLDTNVVVSAILFQGKPWEILELCRKKIVILFSSPDLTFEFSSVLLEKFKLAPFITEEALDLYRQITTTVYPQKKVWRIREDPEDNRVLEAAQEAGAHFVVTGDKHLLKLGTFGGIKILKPTEFLQMIEGTR